VATGWARTRTGTHDDCLVSRVRASGDIVWTRQISGAGIQRCYFAMPSKTNGILVGGRYEPASDPSRRALGLLFALEAETGNVTPGSRHEFAASGARRSAFRSALSLPDGSLALGGWATDETRQGDDVWIMRLTADLQPAWQWRWGESGDAVATGLTYSPAGRIVAVGGTGGANGQTQAFAASVDMDGRMQWHRSEPLAGTVASELQRALVRPDLSITAFGWAFATKDAPAQALVLMIAGTGQPIQPWLLHAFTESRGFDGLLSGRDVFVLGAATPPGVTRPTAWISAPFEPGGQGREQLPGTAALPTGMADQAKATPGEDNGLPRHVSGQLAAGQIAHYGFVVAQSGPIRVSAVPLSGDVDLILRTARGDVVRISDNGGTAAEFIAQTLPAGRYDVEVTCNLDAAFRLDVMTDAQPAAGKEAAELEQSWTLTDKELVKQGLDLLGYRPGESVGVFAAATRLAIRAFQASLGHPASGWLNESERLTLSVMAADAAARRADAAARDAVKAAADPASSAPLATVRGSFIGHFGGELVLGVWNDAKSDALSYRGEWRRKPNPSDPDRAVYAPHGFGVFTDRSQAEALQWVGEFDDWSGLKGFGVWRLGDGQTIYAGEWTILDAIGPRRRGYGALFINADDSSFPHLPVGGFWELQGSGVQTTSILARMIPYQ
jgi:hypothetical protein